MGKRSYDEMATLENAAQSAPLMPMFEQFRAELDEHHDRRERIIKASRDITAASKKIIFTLQRIRKLNEALPQHVVKANKQYYDMIALGFQSVAADLQGINAWRYARQISGGCQEYMEAACFEHYLTNATLLSHEEAAVQMRKLDSEGLGVDLSAEDYLLGIFDMTGELMRFAITSMATSGDLPCVTSKEGDMEVDTNSNVSTNPRRTILNDMRSLRTELESLNAGFGPFAKDVDKKMDIMRASVEKVERSLYGLIVRGAEHPKGWLPEVPRIEVEV